MVHLLRTHSTISKKMVIIPNTPSNEEIAGEETLPLKDLDGSESSFPGLDRRQPGCSLTGLDRYVTVKGVTIPKLVV